MKRRPSNLEYSPLPDLVVEGVKLFRHEENLRVEHRPFRLGDRILSGQAEVFVEQSFRPLRVLDTGQLYRVVVEGKFPPALHAVVLLRLACQDVDLIEKDHEVASDGRKGRPIIVGNRR